MNGTDNTVQPVISQHELAVVMVAAVGGMALVCMAVCALALVARLVAGRRSR